MTESREQYLKKWAKNLLNLDHKNELDYFDLKSIDILTVLIEEKGFENIGDIDITLKNIIKLSKRKEYFSLLHPFNTKEYSETKLEALLFSIRIYISLPERYEADKKRKLQN
ncbi:hypothetical protein HN014_22335 (plasmid) [Aquimarina sp. TRL1]|uniref:hypothetical protein n=1 Tax=Aquimarina sp. (strain TRL1) TaxID=2736252 RepID=UPI00158DF6CE|nr:hypothetical protein [Aquimarina sp. TRL1]QKX07741.1 hypothetical protein HN014_22335 [Aquimarina sp. TRL1]